MLQFWALPAENIKDIVAEHIPRAAYPGGDYDKAGTKNMVKHDIDYTYIRPSKLKLLSDWAVPLMVLCGTFALYIKTMAPGIFWGTAAEFRAAGYIFQPDQGLTYPLFTVFNHLITIIPGWAPAFSANVVSAFLVALSATLFYLAIRRLFQVPVMHRQYKSLPSYRNLIESNPDLGGIDMDIDIERIARPALTELPALAAAILYALTLPIWMAASHTDVYALHMALTMGAIYFSIEGVQGQNAKAFILGIWLYGLSLINHPLLALIFAPAFVLLILTYLPSLDYKLKFTGTLAAVLAVCLIGLLFVPGDSILAPAVHLNQAAAEPSTTASLFDLPAGTWQESWPIFLERLKKLGFYLGEEIEWPMLGLLVFGLAGLVFLSKRIFFFILLGILCYLGFLLQLGELDLENYDMISFMAPLLALVIIATFSGLLFILRTQLLAGHSSVYMALGICVFIYIAYNDNFSKADLSRVEGPEIISKAVLQSMPENSLLVVADDGLLQPLYYYVNVESYNPGICIFSVEQFRDPESRQALKVAHPELKWPDTITRDQSQARYIFDLCRANMTERTIFVQPGVPGASPKLLMPSGILFRWGQGPDSATVLPPVYDDHLALIEKAIAGNPDEQKTADITGRWLFDVGTYYDRLEKDETAHRLYDRAMVIDQNSIDLKLRLARILVSDGKFTEALKQVSDALAMEPQNQKILDLGRRIVEVMDRKKVAIVEE